MESTLYDFCVKCAKCGAEMILFRLKFKGQLATVTPNETKFNVTCSGCGHQDIYPFSECHEIQAV